MSNIILETKNVGDIKGRFFLPAYQRGYRWGKDEITLMLNDLYDNGSKPYCLQPIVVKKTGDKYELIDGQQRLTTLFLIYKYFNSKLGPLYRNKFSLEYETRKKSADFLENITVNSSERNDNIDFFHIAEAYDCIRNFYEPEGYDPDDFDPSKLTKLNEWLKDNVRVIWYEVDSSEDGIELFERLNIGKIALTNSELVKALFLKSDAANALPGRQDEIALQWDAMEHALSDPSLWAFLTKPGTDNYATRIDLILDLMAAKPANSKDAYHTFFYFDNEIKRGKDLRKLWNEIHNVYLTLREWHVQHEFYHKIGYLINSGATTLANIYKIWRGKGPNPLSKKEFGEKLNELVKESIKLSGKEAMADLAYGDDKTKRVLLLFNVETERLKDEGKRRFPFDKHRDGHWSLEHIHAQHSESLKNNKLVLQWLNDHLRIVECSQLEGAEEMAVRLRALKEDLEHDMETAHVRERFNDVQTKTIEFFTKKEGTDGLDEYRDSIANLTLLDGGQNAALSNYVFDVKRDIIINYDSEGRYIPFCTKMVFFKYYSPANASLHFWGEEDRKAYLDAIDQIVSPYYS